MHIVNIAQMRQFCALISFPSQHPNITVPRTLKPGCAWGQVQTDSVISVNSHLLRSIPYLV